MSDSSKPAILLAPLEGLPPLLSPDIHTIILGSFPSREKRYNGNLVLANRLNYTYFA